MSIRVLQPREPRDTGDFAPGSKAGYDVEALETRLLTIGIRERYGYDLDLYDSRKLRLGLRRFAKGQKVGALGALQTRLLREEALLKGLLDQLFAPLEHSEESRKSFAAQWKRLVLPSLKTYPALRFWHLGCSDASLTLTLMEQLKKTKLIERSKVYATELNDLALEQAKTHRLASKLKPYQNRLSYFGHSFLSDSSFNSFHATLVSSRIGGLTREAREKVRVLLFESTVPFGFVYCKEKELLEEVSFLNAFQPLGTNSGWYQKRV